MLDKKEITREYDTSQFLLPYEACSKEEKYMRRYAAIMIKFSMESSSKKGIKINLSDENIYKDLLNVPRSSFYRWCKQEKNEAGSGISGYKRGPKQRGPKNITEEKLNKLIETIKTKYPSDFNINRPLWDRKAVVEFCEKELEVSYSKHQISKILRDNGLVLRRPAKFSVKRDQAKVDTFTNETHQEIVKEAEIDKGVIVYIDETSVQQTSSSCRGFSPVGVAPRLPHHAETSSHGIGSLIIGITMLGFCMYNFIENTCKATDFLWYLEQLMKKMSGVIHIVLDNAKIHKCKKVDGFLKKHRRIKLHYLPPYAPDINPVELFNNALKSNIRHQKAMNAKELKDFTIEFMDTKGSEEDYVKKFFNGEKVQYTKSK